MCLQHTARYLSAATLKNFLNALDYKSIQKSLTQRHEDTKLLFDVFSNKSTISFFLRSILLSYIILFFSCEQTQYSRSELALGSLCTVTLYEQGNRDVYNNIFTRIREIENLMSVNIPSSDVSRINAAAGAEPVKVQEKTFKVIERALFFAQLSGGAFDPAIGNIVSLWNINGDKPRIPLQEEIDAALPLVNWRNIELDAQNCSVFLKYHGMALDLGAIAKGYAADETAGLIKKAGIKRALIDLGGNILIIGEKPDKKPWSVGIQNPLENRGSVIGVLHIPEKTVVTSGVYERFFEKDGKRYHHLFDPSHGYPARTGLLSVTLITDISMDADALSTAVFVLGYEKGISLLNTLDNTEAIFIFEDKSIITTDNINFTLTDTSFKLKNNF